MYGDSVPYLRLEMWLLRPGIPSAQDCFVHPLQTIFSRGHVPSSEGKPKVIPPNQVSVMESRNFISVSFARVDSVDGQWIHHSTVFCFLIHSFELHQVFPSALTKPEFHSLCPDRKRHSLPVF